MSLESKILKMVAKGVQKNKVELGQELISTGLIDSISVMELIMEIKKEFGVEIPFEQIMDIFADTKTLVDFIKKNVK
ncbi:acyl carrier protein [Phocoenobacter uteri]|uniref:Acyl carrier protein n=1 Tax=Phocoenobacter uteri TaxID=146806 RepID=A0A379CCQ3_9PAST|nr:acyl carrier protein [Phocoenobacter uteri]MDG6881409.1 hypothetical protein [Phocoenobacter uteri]SUB59437.1 acyl carrier protein [Phocoenobacter uteri]